MKEKNTPSKSRFYNRFYRRILRSHYAILTIILSLSLAKPAASQESFLDGVVAIVGDEIILKSDVDAQLQFYAYQNQIEPRTSGLWRKMLIAMIDQKILVAKAKIDSIQISTNEIDEEVSRRVDYIKERLKTEEEVQKYFGKSFSQLRSDMREEVRSQRMAQRLEQKRFENLSVSNVEVVEFFNTYKDSLPDIPEEIEMAHILIRPKVDSTSKSAAMKKIRDIEAKLKSGEDFASVAKSYSEDPGSAQQGGDLGFFKRGELVKRFEEVAYALREGQRSKIFETEFGYHIIELLERKGEAIHTRQILIRFDKSNLNEKAALDTLSMIRKSVLNGEAPFGFMARVYSEDEESAVRGGDIVSPQTMSNRIPLESIEEPFRSTILKMNQGDISEPSKIDLPGGNYAFHIIQLKYRAKEHKMNLEQDYVRIKNFALQKRQSELREEWLLQLRKEVFWTVKL
ncbi:MAG: peptidylprolyl isomerase [Chloroherpetonaceae bacterium]|nr:peptidylprolyl isomerase [Chloroherpetonaceae bacterium]